MSIERVNVGPEDDDDDEDPVVMEHETTFNGRSGYGSGGDDD